MSSTVVEAGRSVPKVASMPRRWPVVTPDVCFAAVCLGVAAVRFVILTDPAAPSGIDGGNWLAFGHALLGERIRSSELVYPPVVPLVTSGLVALFGLVNGVAVMAASAAIAPALGAYVVLRRTGLGWWAFGLAALLVGAASTGEAAAWGGYPQLLGLGLLPVVGWSLLDAFDAGAVRRAVLAGVALAAIVATSYYAAIPAMAMCAVISAVAVVRRWLPPRRWLAIVSLVLLPSVLFAPIYLRFANATIRSTPRDVRLTTDGFVDQVALVFRDAPVFWCAAFVVAVGALVARRGSRLRGVVVSMLVAAVAIGSITREPRWMYLMPSTLVLGVGCAIAAHRSRYPAHSAARDAGAAALAVALVAVTFFGLRGFGSQREFYGVMTPGLVRAIEWIDQETPARSLVAVNTARTWALGWWVEGYGHRPTLPSAALRWLLFRDERARARRANEIFRSGIPGDARVALARRWGVDYLLVAKSWEFYDERDADRFVRRHPGSLVFENDGAVVLKVPR
jgi:hypothetical protein